MTDSQRQQPRRGRRLAGAPSAAGLLAPAALADPSARAASAAGSDVGLVTYIGIALIIGGVTALLWPWLVRLARTAGAGRLGAAARRGRSAPERDPAAVMSLGEAYDRPACDRFVAGLGDEVLQRGRVFFRYLAEEGEVDSARLAGRLGAAPGEVAGLLITPLSRRAEAIGAPPPFVEERAPRTRRRVWRDQGGIAERLGATIEVEIARRSPGDAAPPEDDRSSGGATAA